jgi:hypothetical protein
MLAEGELAQSDAAQALAVLAEAARSTGLPTHEIRRTLASAVRP